MDNRDDLLEKRLKQLENRLYHIEQLIGDLRSGSQADPQIKVEPSPEPIQPIVQPVAEVTPPTPHSSPTLTPTPTPASSSQTSEAESAPTVGSTSNTEARSEQFSDMRDKWAHARRGQSRNISDRISSTFKQWREGIDSPDLFDALKQSEFWIGKVGIGLLLLGVVFLFKYSIEQGWITPELRVASGFLIGATLLYFGFRAYKDRRHFSLTLLGGAIATFYISIFSMYQLYALVPYGFAFGLMLTTTALAFILALKQDEVVLSLIGSLGGFATPFLLYRGVSDPVGLAIYISIIIVGGSAVAFFRGWRSLLGLSVLSGWLIYGLVIVDETSFGLSLSPQVSLGLQLGLICAWLCVWVASSGRVFALGRSSVNGTAIKYMAPHQESPSWIPREFRVMAVHQAHFLALSTPLIGLAFSYLLWELSDNAWGIANLAVALIIALGAYSLRKMRSDAVIRKLYETHIVVVALFVTVAIFWILDGAALSATIIAQALAIRIMAFRLSDGRVRIASYLYFALGAFLVTDSILDGWNESWLTLTSSEALSVYWTVSVATLVALKTRVKSESQIFALGAFALLSFLFVGALEGTIEFVALTALASLLLVVSQAARDENLSAGAALYFGAMALYLLRNLAEFDSTGLALLNEQSLAHLLFGAAALALGKRAISSSERSGYFVLGVISVAGILVSEYTGSELCFALVSEAALLLAYTLWKKEAIAELSSHFFTLGLLSLLGSRLLETSLSNPFATVAFTADTAILGFVLTSAYFWKRTEFGSIYALVGHVTFLSIVYHELYAVDNGHAVISTIWGIYAIALMVVALRKQSGQIRTVASITLLVVVAKLFLIDLSHLEAIYRILLFIGFGALLLMLSYFYRRLWGASDAKQETGTIDLDDGTDTDPE